MSLVSSRRFSGSSSGVNRLERAAKAGLEPATFAL